MFVSKEWLPKSPGWTTLSMQAVQVVLRELSSCHALLLLSFCAEDGAGFRGRHVHHDIVVCLQ